jgi:hypothetical protein
MSKDSVLCVKSECFLFIDQLKKRICEKNHPYIFYLRNPFRDR